MSFSRVSSNFKVNNLTNLDFIIEKFGQPLSENLFVLNIQNLVDNSFDEAVLPYILSTENILF